MNKLIKTFNNDNFGQIRIALLNNQPIFNLYDVCFDLGYTTKNGLGKVYLYKSRIEKICKNLEIKGVDMMSTDIKVTRDIDFENTWIIEESFYDLCLESKVKHARKFRKWVTKDILPSIRKEGAYITDKANPEMLRSKADEIESLSVVNETLKIVMDRIDKLQVAEESKVLVMKGILKKAGVEIPIDVTAEQKYYDSMQIAKKVGIYSNSDKPHSQAISAILSKIEILETEKKDVWETNGSWQGTVTKYNDDVIKKIQKWLLDNDYPIEIQNKKKTFHVKYRNLEEVAVCQ